MESLTVGNEEQLTLLLTETETVREEIELYRSYLNSELPGTSWAEAVAKGIEGGEIEPNYDLCRRGLVKKIIGLLEGALVPAKESYSIVEVDNDPNYPGWKAAFGKERLIFFPIEYGEQHLEVPITLLEQWMSQQLYGAREVQKNFVEIVFQEVIELQESGQYCSGGSSLLQAYFVAEGSVELCKNGYIGSLGLFQEKDLFFIPAALQNWLLVARAPTTRIFRKESPLNYGENHS